MRTISMGVSMFRGQYSIDYGGLVAGTLIILIPQLVFYGIFQKNLVEALLSGSIDAFAASEPAPSLALARVPGARQLATLSGLGNSYPLVMVASRAYAQAHPEVLRLLVEGTKKGVDCILADPARAAREIAKLTGAPAAMEERTLKTLEWKVRLDDEVLASLQSTADFLHGIRRLRAVPDLPALSPSHRGV